MEAKLGPVAELSNSSSKVPAARADKTTAADRTYGFYMFVHALNFAEERSDFMSDFGAERGRQ